MISFKRNLVFQCLPGMQLPVSCWFCQGGNISHHKTKDLFVKYKTQTSLNVGRTSQARKSERGFEDAILFGFTTSPCVVISFAACHEAKMQHLLHRVPGPKPRLPRIHQRIPEHGHHVELNDLNRLNVIGLMLTYTLTLRLILVLMMMMMMMMMMLMMMLMMLMRQDSPAAPPSNQTGAIDQSVAPLCLVCLEAPGFSSTTWS